MIYTPDVSHLVKGTECDFCGLVFVDTTQQQVIEDHYVRCLEASAQAQIERQKEGHVLRSTGWFKDDRRS
jgi:predicted nucleic acid-binding Zn ribbon protein